MGWRRIFPARRNPDAPPPPGIPCSLRSRPFRKNERGVGPPPAFASLRVLIAIRGGEGVRVHLIGVGGVFLNCDVNDGCCGCGVDWVREVRGSNLVDATIVVFEVGVAVWNYGGWIGACAMKNGPF